MDGRRLRGDWGDGSPKFEVGGRPVHPSPNILRSSVIGCVRKYEVSKKRCHKGIVSFMKGMQKYRFMLYFTFETVSKDREKRSSELFGVKMLFFPKKVIDKFWSAKFFSVSSNSGPSLRLCKG